MSIFPSLPLRLVCSLAALPVQVQVPAWTCRGRQHPAGRTAAVRNQERTRGERPDAKSAQDRTPKSHLSRKHLIDHPDSHRASPHHDPISPHRDRSSALYKRHVWQSEVFPTDPCALHYTRSLWTLNSQPSSSPRHFKLTRQISWVQREKPLLSISVCHLFICLIMYLSSQSGAPLIAIVTASFHERPRCFLPHTRSIKILRHTKRRVSSL